MGNISLSVWVVRLLVEARICLLLMTPTQNKMRNKVKSSVFLPAWEWFQSGPIQRLMPGGAIIIVMTRWSKLDLTGQIMNQMIKNEDADDWEIVEFPAILEIKTEKKEHYGQSSGPLEELK
jgi:hypothetical protein